ncbi:CHAP domain-containing protein [Enterococcus sp. BWM-S5]|uniref:CHAP domain-containing protein n=1 Tax=Enterococcus larvae TaxID=2794352 RepID=A0ABS4CJG8_9ENTE|nr:CHAP domain-containing protein [Enterococcus larvae]MBP1046757.1 CHAP domain-containing protein [Enterococcus larvae]
MVKKNELVNYLISRIGDRIDEDGMYGAQCMDLTVHVMKKYYGWHPYGNAIALTTQAIPNGFKRLRVYNATEIKKGDVLVWAVGADYSTYGHTAIAIEDGKSSGTFVSVDQNAINPSLDYGSPAAKITHNMIGVWGVIRPVYETEETLAGNLDTFDIKAREIKIGGWHATSNSASGPHSYIFLLNAATGAELHREKITRLVRNDIAQAYPTIPNSKNSGFYLSIPVTDKLLGKQIRIMSRYAKEEGGNGQVSDFDYKPVKATLGRMNGGSLNGIQVEGNSVQLGGWHISNYGDNDTFRYLFLLDATTGQEVKRQTFVSVSRPDVAQAYPGQPFAGKSGFDVRVDTTGLKGRKVKVLARYATDAKGNKIIDDLYFDKVITL